MLWISSNSPKICTKFEDTDVVIVTKSPAKLELGLLCCTGGCKLEPCGFFVCFCLFLNATLKTLLLLLLSAGLETIRG